MNERDAARILSEHELIPAIEAPISYAKELLEACLAAEIPGMLHSEGGKRTPGLPPRVQILFREEDMPRVAKLLQDRWRELAEREGTLLEERPEAEASAPADGDAMACPACGCTQELVEGTCPECGLVLE